MSKKSDALTAKIVIQLQEQMQPVQPDDSIAEAGRKVLQGEFLKMLQHEPGSRTGEDIEDVHKMRVAIRQMRSAFRLLDGYFKPGTLRRFGKDLKRLMTALGDLRDLDVMIHDLGNFPLSGDDRQAILLREVIEALDQRRVVAREDLIDVLDSKAYRRFLKDYADFLMTPGAGVRKLDDEAIVPYQVRHVLPPMIYEHLASVRAYDTVLAEADVPTMHALRIEFKRLRYVVTLFSGVLGKDIDAFVSELKKIQDLLGEMNDIEVARESLTDLMEDLDGDQNGVLWLYIDYLANKKPQLDENFPALWQRFNTKTVQRKLASVVAVL